MDNVPVSNYYMLAVTAAGAAAIVMALGACSASVLTTKQVNTGKAEDLIRTFVQEKGLN